MKVSGITQQLKSLVEAVCVRLSTAGDDAQSMARLNPHGAY